MGFNFKNIFNKKNNEAIDAPNNCKGKKRAACKKAFQDIGNFFKTKKNDTKTYSVDKSTEHPSNHINKGDVFDELIYQIEDVIVEFIDEDITQRYITKEFNGENIIQEFNDQNINNEDANHEKTKDNIMDKESVDEEINCDEFKEDIDEEAMKEWNEYMEKWKQWDVPRDIQPIAYAHYADDELFLKEVEKIPLKKRDLNYEKFEAEVNKLAHDINAVSCDGKLYQFQQYILDELEEFMQECDDNREYDELPYLDSSEWNGQVDFGKKDKDYRLEFLDIFKEAYLDLKEKSNEKKSFVKFKFNFNFTKNNKDEDFDKQISRQEKEIKEEMETLEKFKVKCTIEFDKIIAGAQYPGYDRKLHEKQDTLLSTLEEFRYNLEYFYTTPVGGHARKLRERRLKKELARLHEMLFEFQQFRDGKNRSFVNRLRDIRYSVFKGSKKVYSVIRYGFHIMNIIVKFIGYRVDDLITACLSSDERLYWAYVQVCGMIHYRSWSYRCIYFRRK